MNQLRFLIVFATITIFSSCAYAPHTPAPLPMPERIPLLNWTQEEWDTLSPEIRDKIDYNTEAAKRMIVEREAVIRGHNESLD